MAAYFSGSQPSSQMGNSSLLKISKKYIYFLVRKGETNYDQMAQVTNVLFIVRLFTPSGLVKLWTPHHSYHALLAAAFQTIFIQPLGKSA